MIRAALLDNDDERELRRAYACLDGDGCRWCSSRSTQDPPALDDVPREPGSGREHRA